MTEWFLAELASEAPKSRRVLEQVPTGKRDWKPHERSMELGYLSDLVANIPSWVGMAITLDELDVAPKDGPQYKPTPLVASPFGYKGAIFTERFATDVPEWPLGTAQGPTRI
jgi:hypothetical protein